MGGTIKFDYYYGIEAEQFSFYRVPRLLIKDERFKGLSSDAKLLYGLMLDRMALSMKNGWLDDENRAYIIYTVDSIMEDLGCGKDKAIKVLAELDTNKGIGLVERIRRGLGNAADGERLWRRIKKSAGGKTEGTYRQKSRLCNKGRNYIISNTA